MCQQQLQEIPCQRERHAREQKNKKSRAHTRDFLILFLSHL